MATATLTSKGQITLPESVRERLGVEAGDRLEFIEYGRGFVLLTAIRDIRTLKGLVPNARKAVSVEGMGRAIARRGERQR